MNDKIENEKVEPQTNITKPLEKKALADQFISTLTSQDGQSENQQNGQSSNTTDSLDSSNQTNNGK